MPDCHYFRPPTEEEVKNHPFNYGPPLVETVTRLQNLTKYDEYTSILYYIGDNNTNTNNIVAIMIIYLIISQILNRSDIMIVMVSNSGLIGGALIASGVGTSLVGFGFVIGIPLIVFGLTIWLLGSYTDRLTRYFVIE